METVTFRQETVVDYIEKNVVPLKYESGKDSEQFMRFDISITPTCVVLDHEGNEIGRKKGFMQADELVSFLERVRLRRRNR